ncbi:hypothetical protein Tcan_12412 [Toxocara canis]|uniref:Uncharacterized protein n=1 Tax=Toxocara canis TaxID=6265 RepID=A0A0B2VQ72_TOXCA|nr:hypothetical protein Tcan_12412 [Toxocara canis]
MEAACEAEFEFCMDRFESKARSFDSSAGLSDLGMRLGQRYLLERLSFHISRFPYCKLHFDLNVDHQLWHQPSHIPHFKQVDTNENLCDAFKNILIISLAIHEMYALIDRNALRMMLERTAFDALKTSKFNSYHAGRTFFHYAFLVRCFNREQLLHFFIPSFVFGCHRHLCHSFLHLMPRDTLSVPRQTILSKTSHTFLCYYSLFRPPVCIAFFPSELLNFYSLISRNVSSCFPTQFIKKLVTLCFPDFRSELFKLNVRHPFKEKCLLIHRWCFITS